MRKFPFKDQEEFKIFKKLVTPAKIQDFLDTVPINFEKNRDTCRSPLYSLKYNKAHCMEGALLAAAALWYNGSEPLLLDLKTTEEDESHVVTLFKRRGHWGAISKTNHAVLRYREPIFKNIRELALSYFSEYFVHVGIKTLRSYANPFSILNFEDDWLTSREDLWHIVGEIDSARHFSILPRGAASELRLADPVERKAGRITEWER
jgi:hypothetical protein